VRLLNLHGGQGTATFDPKFERQTFRDGARGTGIGTFCFDAVTETTYMPRERRKTAAAVRSQSGATGGDRVRARGSNGNWGRAQDARLPLSHRCCNSVCREGGSAMTMSFARPVMSFSATREG